MIDAPKNKLRAPLRPLNAPTLALTTLGLGFLRPAPGTWGSMPPPAIAFILLLADAAPRTVNLTIGALCLISCALCVVFGRYSEVRFGRKDAAEVVIDETAGQCLPLLLLPGALFAHTSAAAHGWRSAALHAALICAGAFILFRLADILKPWPARRLERHPDGWGILADDLVAGLYAAGALQLLMRIAY